jgi:hypothetical protein
MCTFITVALPKAAHIDDLLEAFKRAKLGLHPAEDARPVGLLEDESYFFTNTKYCDCGTMLGSAISRPRDPVDHRRRKLEADLRKRGWSDSKIERRLSDFDHTEEKDLRAGVERAQANQAELSGWMTLINEVLSRRIAMRFGVAVNEYRGSVNRAEHSLRRLKVKLENLSQATLIEIEPETLIVITN